MPKPKNILLIIDPQNDFSEPDEGKTRELGALPVVGSAEDYKKIADLIKTDNFDEIHISLDTHTEQHIGHHEFYKDAKDKQGNSHTDVVLEAKNPKLQPYLEGYRNAHPTDRPIMLWNTHCIEGSEGHKIVKELTDVLGGRTNVRYHIKGQNELAEMYSIFSAQVKPKDIKLEGPTVYRYCYKGVPDYTELPADVKEKASDYKYNKLATGLSSYNEAINAINLEVDLNTALLDNLLENNNKVYICGQAKSHCVNDSAIDMLDYKGGSYIENIFLLKDCTSPVKLPPSEETDAANASFEQTAKKLENRFGKNSISAEQCKQMLEKKSTGGKKSRNKRRSSKRSSRGKKRNTRRRRRGKGKK